jgi:hypothetical protein
MIIPPSVYSEPSHTARARARAVLGWILDREESDFEDRLDALSALGALEDYLPYNVMLAPVPPVEGTLADARRLLEQATCEETTARGIVSAALALRRLRRPDDGPPR